MKKCIIWDLDNCLADDAWRIPLIDHALAGRARWARYHSACAADEPGNLDVFITQHTLQPDALPAFVTGRPACVRAATMSWIGAHIELPRTGYTLLMRGDQDECGSVELKRRALRALRQAGFETIMAFDDRADIVEMYRAEGVPRADVLRIHGDMSPHADIKFDARVKTDAFEGSAEDWARDDEVEALLRLRRQKDANIPAVDPRPEAATNMERALATFRRRNADYGGSYKDFGKMLAGMFPHGFSIPPNDAAGWGRLALMVMLAGKLHRYAANYAEGGHRDSAHDAICYAAMLEELTDECPV